MTKTRAYIDQYQDTQGEVKIGYLALNETDGEYWSESEYFFTKAAAKAAVDTINDGSSENWAKCNDLLVRIYKAVNTVSDTAVEQGGYDYDDLRFHEKAAREQFADWCYGTEGTDLSKESVKELKSVLLYVTTIAKIVTLRDKAVGIYG